MPRRSSSTRWRRRCKPTPATGAAAVAGCPPTCPAPTRRPPIGSPGSAAATGSKPGNAGHHPAIDSIAEVAELQGDAEVFLAHRLNGRLQIVSLLAAHPQLLALHLALDTLEPEPLDELVDGGGLVPRDARDQADVLAGGAAGGLLDLAVVERLERHLAAGEPLLQHFAQGGEPVFAHAVKGDLAIAELDRAVRALEVEPVGHLARRLVDGVAHLLHVYLGHDVEAGHTPRVPSRSRVVSASEQR